MPSRYFPALITICLSLLPGCSMSLVGKPSLRLPYDPEVSALIRVDNVFVESDYSKPEETPFGVHAGIHYSPLASHDDDMPYYAMTDGTITKIETLILNGHYNVNVHLAAGGDITVVYQFETHSAETAEGEAQRAKIAVTEGQVVSEGELIGHLHDAGAPSPILHIGVTQGTDPICPTRLMTDSAKAQTQELIERDNPSWKACYAN